MYRLDELTIDDVRCFAGSQKGRVRPITLLVGENSTGKTTFLACFDIFHRVVHQLRRGRDERLAPDFNHEPFSLGSFRDIVRSRRGRHGRITAFRLDAHLMNGGKGFPDYSVRAEFVEDGSQPVLAAWRYDFREQGFLAFRWDEPDSPPIVAIQDHETRLNEPWGLSDALFLLSLPQRERRSFRSLFPSAAFQPIHDFLGSLVKNSLDGRIRPEQSLLPLLPPSVPLAPLRAKPARTYDPVREVATPEGMHVPMLMMRLARADSERWRRLQKHLVAFGKDSGLFTDITVKSHGQQLSDPFQLRVKANSGTHANIVDVGYGVSQSLPILVDVLTAQEEQAQRRAGGPIQFLLQQPEVHLHPRGQAELASFLVAAARRYGHRFLVETHSDYIVDRVRTSVREGRIAADDVSILYFEPRKKLKAVRLYSLRLDEFGNVQNAPPGYRAFFFREMDRTLGFTE